MKTTGAPIKNDSLEGYLSQINWDWLFLKGQLIFSGILLLGLIFFIIWFL